MFDDKKRLIKKDDEKELKNIHSSIKNSVYRDYFHISPVTGLLNDPNGLFLRKINFIFFTNGILLKAFMDLNIGMK